MYLAMHCSILVTVESYSIVVIVESYIILVTVESCSILVIVARICQRGAPGRGSEAPVILCNIM